MSKFWLSLTLFVLISGCRVERREERMVANTEALRARCVGRSVIEIPRSFVAARVTTGMFRARGPGAQGPSFDVVVRSGLTRATFVSAIAKRRSELNGESSDTVNILRLERALSDDATLFRVQEIDDAYVSEINLLRGSSMVTVRLESYHGQFLSAEERIINFAAGIKDTGDDLVVEQTGGFCLGPVVLSGEFADESSRILFRNGKGVNLSIEIDTFTSDEKVALLSRMSGPDSLLTKFDVRPTVLRARERTVAGMRAQEWLGWARLTDEQNSKTLKFALETMRENPGKTTPSIAVTLDTAQTLEDGSSTKTTISDDEAIRLWDSLVNSIHPTKY
jgi:hypothetical protein